MTSVVNDVKPVITAAFSRASIESAHNSRIDLLRRSVVMRKVLISLAAAGTALALATPASAQYYSAPQQYGYGYGYNNYGSIPALQARINDVQRRIEYLRDRRAITRNEANGLRNESRDLERRLYRSSRYGLNPNEVQNIQYRIARLEQHVRHEVRDGRWDNRGYGWNGNNGYSYDRDRDGRDDRYEDDRGYRHD